MIHTIFLALLLCTCHAAADTPSASIRTNAAAAGVTLNPRMYGIFIEEINHGIDGGLYGELVRNRGFEDARTPEGYRLIDGRWLDKPGGWDSGFEYAPDSAPWWSLVQTGGAAGEISVGTEAPLNAAGPRSLRLSVTQASGGRIGIANAGFWGIGVRTKARYRLSMWVRGSAMPLTAVLEDGQGGACSSPARLSATGGGWKQIRAELIGTRNEGKARLVIAAGATGTVWFDMVSLFPRETFKGRPNGLRTDLARMLADLKPGFVRFPGGCIVEGGTVETAYDWKQSVGPLEGREETWGVWAQRRTHGVGFHEYLQFCEDIGAEPLYVGFAGQTCYYRNWEHVPLGQMQPIADSFVEALEYANGPVTSKWGAARAAAGHPKPFGLDLVEIGNENMGEGYEERYPIVFDTIKAKAPSVRTIACFNQTRAKTEMVDDHFYNSPRWFLDNAGLYDRRDRTLPPVYVGEIAVTSGEGGPDKGNLVSALAEGAFLLGCERNGDVVRMVSYAPLLAHIDGRSGWHGMIYHDSLRSYGTASYHLWKLFGLNVPTVTLPTRVDYQPPAAQPIRGAIGLGTWDTSAEFKDLRVEKDGKVVYAADFAKGWRTDGGRWSVVDGAWRQADNAVGLSFAGDENWSDYALSVKARKIVGAEGFLICFGNRPGQQYWWNIGGWGNREHGIEVNRSPVGRRRGGSVETGKWYDIRVQLQGNRVRCYLDGELIHDERAASADKFVSEVGRDTKTGEYIVKTINTSEQAVTAKVSLDGVKSIAPSAQVTELTSGKMDDNNSMTEPGKIVPRTKTIRVSGPTFDHTFPARSLTVIRLKPGR